MPEQSKNNKSTYLPPVAPQRGYRRGFEPRPGETDAQRLKREMEELERRARNRKKYGSDYSHYKNAAGGPVSKPKPKPKDKDQKYAKGGSTASKRADGCATKGKTKGRLV